MFSAVILCAGSGTRLKSDVNKILLPLGDKLVFEHSLALFKEFSDDVILVSNEHDYEVLKSYHDNVVLGGKTRQESVLQGVKACKHEVVLIHDGARPFLTSSDLLKLVLKMETSNLAFLGLEMINSLKEKESLKNVNRNNYVMALTPQAVLKSDYLKASEIAKEQNLETTDDVSLVSEALKLKPEIVYGSEKNFKITTKEDYELAKKLVSKEASLRIGHSWDLHKLVKERPLYLGGILIPSEVGLLGHSDADCLLHAIAESLLGALSLGDLGTHFPDNDPKYLNIDSKILLKECYQKVLNLGYEIVNLDTMVYAERPKLKPYILKMREKISEVLGIELKKISIKATTFEGLDSIGEGKAIAASAMVLLKSN